MPGTASEIFDVPLSEVTPTLRSRAKAVNFGLIYGISGFGLARNTGVTQKEAKEFIARYFAKYPGVKRFMDEAVRLGQERGLRGNPAGAAALPARAQFLPQRHPGVWPPGGHEHPRPGHRRGHQSSWPWCAWTRPCAGRTCRPR